MATLVLLRTFESEVEARVVESFLLAAGIDGHPLQRVQTQ